MRGWFVTGTDTHVGKTFVSVGLVRWLNQQGIPTGAYKPVASGCTVDTSGFKTWEDVEQLFSATGGKWTRHRICPQQFELPLAPPIAARRERKYVDENLLLQGAEWWMNEVSHLIVEGAGGWKSPMSESWSNADVAKQLGFPVLLVARLGLGTINHALLTLEAIERESLPVLGIILTENRKLAEDISTEENPSELAKRTKVPILAVIPYHPVRVGEIPKPLQQRIWCDLAESPDL